MADGDDELPRDAKIVKSLLKSMGIEDYEPGVVHQLLEIWYRYTVDVLTDAQIYSKHADKSKIDCDDIKLAIKSKTNFSFSQPPPREVLIELAKKRNNIPLPKMIPGPELPLPPEQDTLIYPSYKLLLRTGQPSQPVEETEEDEESADPNPAEDMSSDISEQPR